MLKKRYSYETIQKIRHSVFLPHLIQKYTKLDKYNRALCPFHKDSNPSLSINARKGLWYCFSCCKGGDAFSFIMQVDKVSFPKAVRLVALEVGIRLPELETVEVENGK